MATLIDNWLDLSFEAPGNSIGAHSPYLYPAPSGEPWTLKKYISPDVGEAMILTFPPGSMAWSGWRSVLWLRPDPTSDRAYSQTTSDLAVTPGQELKASIHFSLGGSWSGISSRRARLVITFRTPTGNVTAGSEEINPKWSSQGGSTLTATGTAPDNVTSAYLMLQAEYDSADPYPSISSSYIIDEIYFGTTAPAKGGVAEVSAATDARLGIVSDIYSRSREKIQLKLAGVDDLVRSGHRIELAAAAMTSTPAVWHWRQVTGPTVALNVRENTCDFIAPDVERSTRIRIGVYAASEDGGNRSDWHYFDLDVEPPMLRFRGGDDGDFSPRSPYLVGYSRGKREIWNDVIRPATYEKNPRHELEVVDLGVPDDDVVFSTETPRRMAAGGVWVNPETGDVYRNFGAGYNETDDTTASPRTSTYWVNPANGDILEWIED